jgi:hypothetical protein
MSSEKRLTVGRAFTLAVIPALFLARCGIWPSFPEQLLTADAGPTTDARADATDARADASDATSDASSADATATDAAPDVVDAAPDAPTRWYGFLNCGPLPMIMPMVEPAFTGPDGGMAGLSGVASPRDIMFDGEGRMLVSGRDTTGNAALFSIDSMGRSTVVYSSPASTMIATSRFLPDGRIVLAATAPQTVGGMTMATPGVTIITRTGMMPQRLQFSEGFAWAVAVHPTGNFFVSDSVGNRLLPFTAGMLPMTVPMPVDSTGAPMPGLENPRSMAFSADYRHLFVASGGNSVIHEFDVSETGMINGASRRVYATLPSVGGVQSTPRSIAFDECGNLYITGTILIGGANMPGIYRVPARGGMPQVLISNLENDSQRSLAFGAGPGFSDTSLYIADSTAQVVRRINVGVRGQAIVRPEPSMMMMRDM